MLGNKIMKDNLFKKEDTNMAISNELHIKYIWLAIASMVIGWASGVWYQQAELNELKYNTGIELAKINTVLQQMSSTLNEIKRELRREGINIYRDGGKSEQ